MSVEVKKPKKNEYGEYVVRVYIDGQFSESDSYYTNDLKDAENTRNSMIEHFNKEPTKEIEKNHEVITNNLTLIDGMIDDCKIKEACFLLSVISELKGKNDQLIDKAIAEKMDIMKSHNELGATPQERLTKLKGYEEMNLKHTQIKIRSSNCKCHKEE